MFDLEAAKIKQSHLDQISSELKQELFGIDHIIDKVIGLIRVWYIMPELITRPVIINLWGLTGVGKTDLVRRLTRKLKFQDRFVEVQMDGFSNGTGHWSSSLTGILSESTIQEGKPGIMLLDEMQRFRTVEQGADVKLERYQDVWMLLSDGKLGVDSGFFNKLETMILDQEYYNETKEDEEDDIVESADEVTSRKEKKISKFISSPWVAGNLKKTFKLDTPIRKIMEWSNDDILALVREYRNKPETAETDYSKLLIFIAGNLDELFTAASAVGDSDTDADMFYYHTSKLTPSDVKSSLMARFKPEQISRFGSNNIIYPSLNKEAYSKIIHSTCASYLSKIENISKLRFSITDKLYNEIYDNSVYPAQGTRPVFSAIHQILSSPLSEFAMWALENGLNDIQICADLKNHELIASSGTHIKKIATSFEIRKVKETRTDQLNTIIAVHEAGHAVVSAVLFKEAPSVIKISLASYEGGYTRYADRKMYTKEDLIDYIAVCLAGDAAEQIVFGESKTLGYKSDLQLATQTASELSRSYGVESTTSFVLAETPGNNVYNTNMDIGNEDIEKLIIENRKRASSIIRSNIKLFKDVISELLEKKVITSKRFIELSTGIEFKSDPSEPKVNYIELLNAFNKRRV